MPKRLCSVCFELIDKLEWQRHRDAHRGTRRQRGIGPNHEALARDIKAHPDRYLCNICYDVPTEDNPLTVGHIVSRMRCLATGRNPDDPSNLQPECRRCNLRKGAS